MTKRNIKRWLYGSSGILVIIWVYILLEGISNSSLFQQYWLWALIVTTVLIVILIIIALLLKERRMKRYLLRKARGR